CAIWMFTCVSCSSYLSCQMVREVLDKEVAFALPLLLAYLFIRTAEIHTRKIYTPRVLMVSGFDMKPKSVKGSSTIPDMFCDFKPGYRCLDGSLNQGGFLWLMLLVLKM